MLMITNTEKQKQIDWNNIPGMILKIRKADAAREDDRMFLLNCIADGTQEMQTEAAKNPTIRYSLQYAFTERNFNIQDETLLALLHNPSISDSMLEHFLMYERRNMEIMRMAADMCIEREKWECLERHIMLGVHRELIAYLADHNNIPSRIKEMLFRRQAKQGF